MKEFGHLSFSPMGPLVAVYALCVLEPSLLIYAICVLEPLWPFTHFVCLSLLCFWVFVALYALCVLERSWLLGFLSSLYALCVLAPFAFDALAASAFGFCFCCFCFCCPTVREGILSFGGLGMPGVCSKGMLDFS